MPRKSNQCYIVKPVGAPSVAFVAVPGEDRWVRTSPCVAVSECPQCSMPAGIPCKSDTGRYTVSHHSARGDAARALLRGKAPLPGLVIRIDEIGLAAPDLKTLIRSVFSGRE